MEADWNNENLKYLIDNYQTKTIRQIAEDLELNFQTVKNKRHRLLISKVKTVNPQKMNGINDSWEAVTQKINTMNQKLEKLHTQLQTVKKFSEFMTIRRAIDNLNRHLEVVETMTNDRKSEEIKRKMFREYAINSTK